MKLPILLSQIISISSFFDTFNFVWFCDLEYVFRSRRMIFVKYI